MPNPFEESNTTPDYDWDSEDDHGKPDDDPFPDHRPADHSGGPPASPGDLTTDPADDLSDPPGDYLTRTGIPEEYRYGGPNYDPSSTPDGV